MDMLGLLAGVACFVAEVVLCGIVVWYLWDRYCRTVL